MLLSLYRSTPTAPETDMIPGQWVRLPGHVKPGRFVRYNTDGTAYILPPVGRGKRARVNMKAFRLACGKTLPVVVPVYNTRVSLGMLLECVGF